MVFPECKKATQKISMRRMNVHSKQRCLLVVNNGHFYECYSAWEIEVIEMFCIWADNLYNDFKHMIEI